MIGSVWEMLTNTTAYIPYKEKYLFSVTPVFSDIKINQDKGRASAWGQAYSIPNVVHLGPFLARTFGNLCLVVLTIGSRNHTFGLTTFLPQLTSPPLWLSLLYAVASFSGLFHLSLDPSAWISLTTSSSEADPQADSASCPNQQQFSHWAVSTCQQRRFQKRSFFQPMFHDPHHTLIYHFLSSKEMRLLTGLLAVRDWLKGLMGGQ